MIEDEKIARNQTPKIAAPQMSEVNGKTLSISFRINEGVIEHNNRIIIAKNVDGERLHFVNQVNYQKILFTFFQKNCIIK